MKSGRAVVNGYFTNLIQPLTAKAQRRKGNAKKGKVTMSGFRLWSPVSEITRPRKLPQQQAFYQLLSLSFAFPLRLCVSVVKV
jgi:hypothetical protein